MKPLFATRNRAAARLAETLARLASSDLPVLLEGETGSGKSHLAGRLHRSGRPGRPLVVVDCGVVPEALLPSELFGHRAGAFTDAARARIGLLERAGDGTVVLDRVDALALDAQVLLLRVLEERRFRPVGASSARPFRARVVALVAAGLSTPLAERLRPDLYHRLAGYHAVLPPLRERPEDILPAARVVLRRSGRTARRVFSLSAEAVALLEANPWPGNFRELETTLQRACLLAGQGEIGADLVAAPLAAWPAMADLAAERARPLAEVARLYALTVLARTGGNVTRAAGLLGVSRRTVIRWRQGS